VRFLLNATKCIIFHRRCVRGSGRGQRARQQDNEARGARGARMSLRVLSHLLCLYGYISMSLRVHLWCLDGCCHVWLPPPSAVISLYCHLSLPHLPASCLSASIGVVPAPFLTPLHCWWHSFLYLHAYSFLYPHARRGCVRDMLSVGTGRSGEGDRYKAMSGPIQSMCHNRV